MTRPHDTPARFPWEQGHACPQDRALGLELELIELVRERDEADAASAAAIDQRIMATMDDLEAQAAATAASWPGTVPTV